VGWHGGGGEGRCIISVVFCMWLQFNIWQIHQLLPCAVADDACRADCCCAVVPCSRAPAVIRSSITPLSKGHICQSCIAVLTCENAVLLFDS
jgi:hypothetical protein